MSEVDASVDLGALARAAEPIRPPRRGGLALGAALVLLVALALVLRGPLLEWIDPPPRVTLARPVALDGAAASGVPSTGIVVQAAGWIEPDPFPTFAPALDGGVVVEMLVEESDSVEAGAPVARLVDDVERITVADAEAAVARAEATLETARARAGIARERFDAALGVTEAAERASARLDGAETEAEHRAEAVREGEARLELAQSEVVVQEELRAAGASGARQVEIAEAEVEVARARLAILRADAALAVATADEVRATRTRAEADVELRFEDRLVRDTTAADARRAEAELAGARATLARAALGLERTVVRAPRAGVVLERLASDGESLSPGAPVCSLYAPDALRVRVDVPQGDVERLSVGQRAEILTDARPGRPYAGEVIRVVQRADIQKVTLEAQVRVLDADDLVRPDMLAQVRFFGAREDGAPRTARAGERFGVEARLLRGDRAWVYEPAAGVARDRQLELGAEVRTQDGRRVREVLGGLDFTEELIDEGRDAVAASAGDAGVLRVRVLPTALAPGGTER
ncbi:MAG: HlyD family efflux transporter periplasmic adaptor subunit [Planctomycetota bacterium]